MLPADRKAKGKRQTKATECQPASPCPLPQQAPNHDHTSCPLPRPQAQSRKCAEVELEAPSVRMKI